MSRCFPYPPPGYVRTPVAVAESETTAKLLKEREKAEKKAKRSDRKALQNGETSKHSKHSHRKRKHENIGKVGKEPETSSKELAEQLEKSGLTEEHGAPSFVQTIRNSPESSQDSSKRRKVVMLSPSQAKNGNILRIKIKRDQDSPRGVEQPSVKLMGLGSLSKPNSIQQHNNVNFNSADAVHQQNNVVPAIQKQATTQHSAKLLMRDCQQIAKVVQQMDPKLSVKPAVGGVDLLPVRVDPPLVKRAQRDQPSKAVPSVVLQRVEPQVPSAEIQRKCPPVCPKDSQEVSTPARLGNVQPPFVKNSKLQPTGMNQLQRPSSSLLREEPSSSGRNAEAVQGQEAKQSKSDSKKSRKAEKKEKKFRDLFVTWNPPSFETVDSDVCEQDWLFGSTRNSDASMINCRASDGSVPFQSMEQQPSLQPRATFLPDLHIYQLPYVVPF